MPNYLKQCVDSLTVSSEVHFISFEHEMKSSLKGVLEVYELLIEPRREKTGLRGFRPGATQIGLYSHRSRLDT